MIWEKKEERYLRRWYGKKEPKIIAEHFGISTNSIYSKAFRMGLTAPHNDTCKIPRGRNRSKVDKVEYNPELNAPLENWYALFICIHKKCSVDKALGLMGLRAHEEILHDVEVS